MPSNLGGLGGSGSYFTSRYQTPQTNEVVANLKATAQAQALNDAMNNALAQAKQRYNNAYKAAQKRANNPTNPNNPNNPNNPSNPKLPIDTNSGGDQGKKLKADGLDTVSKKRGAPKASSSINAANTVAGMTGGGQLPNANTRTYYLQAPNGNKTWIVVRNGLNGPGIDTPKVSMHGSNNIRNYIGSRLRQGYKVVDGKGNDLSSRYSLLWGL